MGVELRAALLMAQRHADAASDYEFLAHCAAMTTMQLVELTMIL